MVWSAPGSSPARSCRATVRFWTRLGYAEAGRVGSPDPAAPAAALRPGLPDAAATRALGRRLAAELAAGDLVILTGDLGAGKTTLTQGLGDGLGVRGDVTSPTFVIARVHPSLGDGPELVHVDAYRLGGAAELDDLDLDTDLDLAVTVVEWGEGLAESLAADRLEVALRRDHTGESEDGWRRSTPVGSRWLDPGLPARLSGRLA